MKFVKDNILFIAVMLLVLWLYFFTKPTYIKQGFDTHDYKKVLTVTDTMYQNKYINRYKKGDSIPYVIIATDTTEIHDTVRILSDYMRIYAYSDTINIDSSTFVILDTILENRIKSREFKAKISQQTILTKEYYTDKNKNTLYLGIRGSYSPLNGLEVLSPSLMLSVKNKAIIGLSVDFNKNYNISYSGGFYLKIGKK